VRNGQMVVRYNNLEVEEGRKEEKRLENGEAKVKDLGRIEGEKNVRLIAGELGERLELSAAPSVWPSDYCRRIREREMDE